MFAGIIHTLGRVRSIEPKQNLLHLRIDMQKRLTGVVLGSSVAINGVCLTVTKIQGSVYSFDVLKEPTLKSTLHLLHEGEIVHVETSLKVGDEIGGHFVYGHVDGVGKIVGCEKISKKKDADFLLTIEPPKNIFFYLAPQGSITIQGVSLTVSRLNKKNFSVSLVPYTLEHTTFLNMKKGDRVNLEADMIAKYVVGLKLKK